MGWWLVRAAPVQAAGLASVRPSDRSFVRSSRGPGRRLAHTELRRRQWTDRAKHRRTLPDRPSVHARVSCLRGPQPVELAYRRSKRRGDHTEEPRSVRTYVRVVVTPNIRRRRAHRSLGRRSGSLCLAMVKRRRRAQRRGKGGGGGGGSTPGGRQSTRAGPRPAAAPSRLSRSSVRSAATTTASTTSTGPTSTRTAAAAAGKSSRVRTPPGNRQRRKPATSSSAASSPADKPHQEEHGATHQLSSTRVLTLCKLLSRVRRLQLRVGFHSTYIRLQFDRVVRLFDVLTRRNTDAFNILQQSSYGTRIAADSRSRSRSRRIVVTVPTRS